MFKNAPLLGFCAKTLDYLQQVHLWIISCFKIAPSPPTCTNTEGLRTAQVVGQCSSKAEDGRMRRRDPVSGVCKTGFITLLSSCRHLLARGRPAGLGVSLFPSPAGRRSRSRTTRRGWTVGNLKGQEERRKQNLKGKQLCRADVESVDNPVTIPQCSAVDSLRRTDRAALQSSLSWPPTF